VRSASVSMLISAYAASLLKTVQEWMEVLLFLAAVILVILLRIVVKQRVSLVFVWHVGELEILALLVASLVVVRFRSSKN